MPVGSCTGAQGANSPRDIHRGHRSGHGSIPSIQGTRRLRLLPTDGPPSPETGDIRILAGSLDRLHPPYGFASALRAPAKP